MAAQSYNTAAARALFEISGTSVAEWARVRGFSAGLVYQVLEGKRKCMRGQSHQIAIALGLKQGECFAVDELSRRLLDASNGNQGG
ncbi:DNA-binding protein [Herbaspirillum huttiense]|uniref:DNA-binding protein n=1 Tax=Herbaspirillum huttiense TaxID=863372 RepID=UPI003CF0D502